jgi:hypothetical protein
MIATAANGCSSRTLFSTPRGMEIELSVATKNTTKMMFHGTPVSVSFNGLAIKECEQGLPSMQ